MRYGFKQFSGFSLIGLGNGAIDLAVLNLLLWMWPSRNPISLLTINTIAYALAVLNSYIWNSRLTFRRHAQFSKLEKLSFLFQAVISLVISNVVFLFFSWWLWFFTPSYWLVHNASKLISMALSSLASFFFMKNFVFKSRSPRKQG